MCRGDLSPDTERPPAPPHPADPPDRGGGRRGLGAGEPAAARRPAVVRRDRRGDLRRRDLRQRLQRAAQLAGGVVLGISVASLIVPLIGTGSPQIGLMVVLAMTAAVLLGGGELLISEAAVSAILLVALTPADSVGLHAEPHPGGADRRRDVARGHRAAVPARPEPARRPRGAGRVRRARRRAGAPGRRAGGRRCGRRRPRARRRPRRRCAGLGVRRGAGHRPRDRPPRAARAAPRWPSSSATPRASRRSTSRCATRACWPATGCGCCAPARRCPASCRNRYGVGRAVWSSPAPTSVSTAATRCAATRCAQPRSPPTWDAEIGGQVRSTAVDLRRAADLVCGTPDSSQDAPTEELLAPA